jgi:hypothetical protein
MPVLSALLLPFTTLLVDPAAGKCLFLAAGGRAVVKFELTCSVLVAWPQEANRMLVKRHYQRITA